LTPKGDIMLLSCWRCKNWLPVLVIGLACLWAVVQAHPASAQTSCDGVIGAIDGSLTSARCKELGFGTACLAVPSVSATPRSGTLVFTAPGHTAALNNISRMATLPQRGSAVLLGGTTANPVKILVFGDTSTAPNRTQPGSVLTLRASNGQPTCDRTRSGMLLQTPDGQTGTLIVNGVRISLGSSVYVVPGADLIFDQDPRIDRRQGSRNRNAPLCSGFDSDCSFGDGQCSERDRLVYGPFCREDVYPSIEPGLYRVTLYGEGVVQAGATDYNITRDYEMMGTQRLILPDSYTFCWEGLQENGTGFETIVQARSEGAYVDHITVEYLGQNCSLRGANNPEAGKGSGEMGVMAVYNIEGDVDVSMPGGRQVSPSSGERIRLYYRGNELVGMDEGPTDAPYIMESELVQWATGEGLPAVDIVEEPVTYPPADPVVSVTAEVLYDDDYPYALRIEARAYDPDVGTRNGDGIESVDFTIRNEAGRVVVDNSETDPAYCAFGGDSPCQQLLSERLGSGEFQVTATAHTASGREASDTAYFSLAYEPPTDPEVSVTADVVYRGNSPYALRIEAQAYDPGVGTRNGDGIDYVRFTVRHESGAVIYENDEASPAYCAFGGDSPCQQLLSERFRSGVYEVTATASSMSGRTASDTTTFTLDLSPGGDSDSEPTPSDTAAPRFGRVSHNAPDGFCPGGSLVAGVEVYDNVGVERVTFWWRAYSDDVGRPEFQSHSLGGGDGYHEADLSGTTARYVDFYFTAVDAAGNESESNLSSVYRTVCSRID
jgi:hypothetical protein